MGGGGGGQGECEWRIEVFGKMGGRGGSGRRGKSGTGCGSGWM